MFPFRLFPVRSRGLNLVATMSHRSLSLSGAQMMPVRFAVSDCLCPVYSESDGLFCFSDMFYVYRSTSAAFNALVGLGVGALATVRMAR